MPEQSEGQTPETGFTKAAEMQAMAEHVAGSLDTARAAEQARVDALPKAEIDQVPVAAAQQPEVSAAQPNVIESVPAAQEAQPSQAPDMSVPGAAINKFRGGNVTTTDRSGYGSRQEYSGNSLVPTAIGQAREAAYKARVGLPPKPTSFETPKPTGLRGLVKRLFSRG